MSLLLALAPYLLYNTASYPPRFSIHLLPLAVLVLGAGRRA